MKIGVLAIQGAFEEHILKVNALGANSFEIRRRSDINDSFDGLILPGGESTVMGKLLHDLNLFSPLKDLIKSDFPVFGTCAGLLLLAKEIVGGTPVFSTMNIKARRNAYGRQLGSFEARENFAGLGQIPMTFIRGPYVESTADHVTVLAQVDGHIVAAQEGRQLVTAFHPELTDNLKVHKYFLDEVVKMSCII